MAFQSGVATDNIDLWNKLISFLTSDPGLAAEDSLWDIVASYTGGSNNEPRHVLRGKGTSPNDAIYVALVRTDTPGSDGNRINVMGMTGFNPNATAWNQHINMCPEKRMWLDVNPMKYWFVANSRRFIVVVNMSTVYEMMYAGFYLPYANPLTYTYPLLIGGSSNQFSSDGTVDSWRSQHRYHSHFMYSSDSTYGGSPFQYRSNSHVVIPDMSWAGIAPSQALPISFYPRYVNALDEFLAEDWGLNNNYNYSSTYSSGIGCRDLHEKMSQCLGGGYSLRPFTLLQSSPSIQELGILDGIYAVAGVMNAAENIVRVDGVDHLIVQNVWRATTEDYWALRLE